MPLEPVYRRRQNNTHPELVELNLHPARKAIAKIDASVAKDLQFELQTDSHRACCRTVAPLHRVAFFIMNNFFVLDKCIFTADCDDGRTGSLRTSIFASDQAEGLPFPTLRKGPPSITSRPLTEPLLISPVLESNVS